jgi:putative membrane protein
MKGSLLNGTLRGAAAVTAVSLGLACVAVAQDAGKAVKLDDRTFVMMAAMSDMAEITLGKVAVAQAGSDDVKKFGQKMIDDHTKSSMELMALLKSKGLAPPAPAIDQKHKAEMDQLTRLRGADFDRAYMGMMVKDHMKVEQLYEAQSKQGQDPDLKAFAVKVLPVVQEHLKLAKTISGKIGAGGTGR